MDNQIKKMRDIFNEVDPVGIYFDNNKDEYDPEIIEFMGSLHDFDDVEKIFIYLQTIFQKYFDGMEISDDTLKLLAQKIKAKFS